jgi:hypothetical protein
MEKTRWKLVNTGSKTRVTKAVIHASSLSKLRREGWKAVRREEGKAGAGWRVEWAGGGGHGDKGLGAGQRKAKAWQGGG